MEKAREHFATLEILLAPRNSSIVDYRSQKAKISKESRELDNNHENSISANFSFPRQEKFNKNLKAQTISH